MTRTTKLLAAMLFGLSAFTGVADARDYSSLYSDATLTEWAERYRPGIMGNYHDVLLPHLDPAERRAFRDLAIEIPLRAEGGDPLNFYAYRPATVVLPAMSLKFLDDLTIAYAWLWKNGYSLETALEYVGLLKYGKEADFGRWPQPRKALRIPDNALDDPDVDSLSQKMFKSAVIFILLHEMGHVLYQHPGYGPGVARADARANEAQADAFALEVMRRLPAQPTGMIFFFQTLVYFGANRGDYASDAAFQAALDKATHPVTPDRMRAIADILRKRAGDFAAEYRTRAEGVAAAQYLADQIAGVAGLIDDPDLQRLIAQNSRRATLAGLAPRKPGETLGATAPAGDTSSFAGMWDGVLTGSGIDFPVRMILERNGERVAGFYNYGAGVGQLDGIVKSDTAWLEWRSGGERGRARLTSDGGGLSGSWGYGDPHDNGGTWRFGPGQ